MTVHTLELPNLDRWTPNSRGHWRERHAAEQAWQTITRARAQQARLPQLDRVAIRLTMTPRDRRRRDPDNLAGVLKPAIDGLRLARVLVDDHAGIVREVALRIATPDPTARHHRWVLELTDLTEETP